MSIEPAEYFLGSMIAMIVIAVAVMIYQLIQLYRIFNEPEDKMKEKHEM